MPAVKVANASSSKGSPSVCWRNELWCTRLPMWDHALTFPSPHARRPSSDLGLRGHTVQRNLFFGKIVMQGCARLLLA